MIKYAAKAAGAEEKIPAPARFLHSELANIELPLKISINFLSSDPQSMQHCFSPESDKHKSADVLFNKPRANPLKYLSILTAMYF